MSLENPLRRAARAEWASLVAPCGAVWLTLMAATALSLATGAGHHDGGVGVALIVLGVAFVKVLLIGEYFMELRHAPPLLRGAFVAYCIAGGTVMVFLAG